MGKNDQKIRKVRFGCAEKGRYPPLGAARSPLLLTFQCTADGQVPGSLEQRGVQGGRPRRSEYHRFLLC